MNAVAVAEYLGTCRHALRGLINAGAFPAIKFGNVVRLKRTDVDGYIERCGVRPVNTTVATVGGSWRSRLWRGFFTFRIETGVGSLCA